MATISEALQIAFQHHQAGHLDLAEEIYRRILRVEPDQPEALHRLGLIAYQVGQSAAAVDYLGRAITLSPSNADYHYNLGIAFKNLGRLDEAVACYRRALELKPGYARVHYNLGNASKEQGKLDEAVACYRRALEVKPDYAEAHYNLGVVLQSRGKLDEAVACYRRALELKPDFAEAYSNLGSASKDQGRLDEAVACYRRAVDLKPDYAEAHYNLGVVLLEQWKLDEAVACYRRALELKPDFAEAHNNLGNAFKDQGWLDGAIACLRRALELKPDFAEAHSNLVYALNFCVGYDVKTIDEEHRRWNRQFAEPLRRFIEPHRNDPSPDRRLRIGYVSPDLCAHPVGRFLVPLVEEHDHERVEIFCYSSTLVSDTVTDRIRRAADVWRVAVGLSDEELAAAVRHDRIDVLVDLTMHMARNRMLVFARKPAPVQVTYLAYCGTTGLPTIDYRLTDAYLDPPGGDEPLYCELPVRLPETYWCYRPMDQTPDVNRLPALDAGGVTFGSLNNFCKVTPPTLAAWCRLLRAVPASRLLLHARPGSHRDHLRALLAQHGIEPERLSFADVAPMMEYLRLYQQIDIALDPFPYGGGTTTCDALWMGVPVVSLAGETGIGRGGLSILSNIGLPELVARDVDDYARIARELAGDLGRLGRLRATLRDRMQKSPLMDASRFARNVEAAYRQMWRQWCDQERPKT